MEDFSVFDIIGPRMTGPSSSHTAGAVRLSHIARKIAGEDVAEAAFTLYGSFAETGKGHGTDKALVAGALGMDPDDPRIKEAFDVAREQGIPVSVEFSDQPPKHPNTARIVITGSDGHVTDVLGESVGGGNILITEINGLDVEFSGEYPTLVIQHDDKPGVIAEVSHVLAQLNVNIAFMRVFRHGKGEDAYMTIETDQPVTQEMQAMILRLCSGINKLFAV
ncbi:MAG: L-serine ammonia-lyase, iron-sulfur-dependent, subunit beta [Clostridiales bacterium]|nr:L-serine ammonia-lyase, iron-sulfur-dependent, subunit beta [Clostridiales bacterium]